MSTRLKDFATDTVVVADPETTALAAAKLMRKHHVGALVVVDGLESNRPVGIVTDRDLVLALMAEGLDPEVFTAGDIMSVELVTASAALDAMDAVQLMRANRLRRIVIVDDDGRLPYRLTHRCPPRCVCWSDCARLRFRLPRSSRARLCGPHARCGSRQDNLSIT